MKKKTVTTAKKTAVANTGFKVEYNGLNSKIIKHKLGPKKVPKSMHPSLAKAKTALLSKLRGDYQKSVGKIKNLKNARSAVVTTTKPVLPDEASNKSI